MTRERFLMIAVLFLMIAVGLLTYRAFLHEPKVVVAEAFELVDGRGTPRAVLSISP